MATYILLVTLTHEAQVRVMNNADFLFHIEHEIDVPDVEMLGVYAVLGPYDFVTMVAAPSNEAMARFSIALGVKAGVHITTLPVIPTTQLEVEDGGESTSLYADMRLDPEAQS